MSESTDAALKETLAGGDWDPADYPLRRIDSSDCDPELRTFIRELRANADDDDPELRSTNSVDRYEQDIRWFQAWLWDSELEATSVDEEDARRLGLDIGDAFNGTTPANRWRTIFTFYDDMDRSGTVEQNPLSTWDPVKKKKFGFSNTTEQERHLDGEETYAVSQEEVRQMEENRQKIRDQLIIRMLWQTGLRRGELSELEIDDVDRDAREVEVRAEVAKGDKGRVVPYQPNLDGLLNEWLDYGGRSQYRDSEESDYLLVGERGPQLSADRIKDIVVEAACDAEINRVLYQDSMGRDRWKITPHSLRHGYGSYLANQTDAGIYAISNLLGHSSVKITEEIYVEDDERAGVEVGHRYGPE